MDGFILIDKEKDWTSRDVCNKIQHIFHMKKVGHVGTLDPFATGLLVVTLGKGTKAGTFLENQNKSYVATLVLGTKKDTADITGNDIDMKDINPFTKEDILNVFKELTGEIEQIPPMTSAIHYNGKKLYQYAFQGIEVERKSRKVHINDLKLISFDEKNITFECNVSKGTYVRTLGEQIAEKLNNVGYLSSLRRISIASLKVEDANKINEVNESDVISISKGLSHLTKIIVNEIDAIKIKNGIPFHFNINGKNDIIFIVDKKDNPLAIYQKVDKDYYKCLRGLF